MKKLNIIALLQDIRQEYFLLFTTNMIEIIKNTTKLKLIYFFL